MFRFKLLLISTCIFVAFIACKAKIIHTKLSNGSPINGYDIKSDGRKIHVFRGIPYAKKPTNKLRFQRPQPVLIPSHKPLNAFNSGAACPGSTVLLTNQTINESCLFMDVFVDQLCMKVSCPVSVFINKPESFYREDDEMTIDSKTIPEVIVFFNFRFGPFGFLDFGRGSEMSSNAGLYDVTTALKWIKQEVASFGGDPTKLTILSFGDFAASMIQYLLSSTEAEELPLSRLVLVDPRPILMPHSNLVHTKQLLNNLDCLKGANSELMNAYNQFVCLRMKSTKTIVDATSGFQKFRPQSDTNLLNARSYIDLLNKKWTNSTIYIISHKDEPFASDHNKTITQLCYEYVKYMFGYTSLNSQNACIEYYSTFENGQLLIGRHATHALNTFVGAKNNQFGGNTYLAIFSQPNMPVPDLNYRFLNDSIDCKETSSQHEMRILYLESIRRFVHYKLNPVANFVPVNNKGQNYYLFEYNSDNSSNRPKMYLNEWFNKNATLFWLETLAQIEKQALNNNSFYFMETQHTKYITSSNFPKWIPFSLFGIMIGGTILFVIVKFCQMYGIMSSHEFERKQSRFLPTYSSINS